MNMPVYTLPDGLYGADSLNLSIKRWLKSLGIPGGGGRFSEDAIKITADIATQKLVFEMAQGLQLSTSDALPENVAKTLGFTNDIIATFTGESFLGDNIAELNRINSFLIHTDLVHDGLSINSSYDSILTDIQLTVSPGSLLTYRPYIPYRVTGKHLKYGTKDLITFRLTDEQNRHVDTFGEEWSLTIIIRYKIHDHSSMLQLNVPHV